MKVIAFINKKGGCGKTTLISALGLYWAVRAGKRVAIQDMEVDGGSTAFVEMAAHPNLSVYESGESYDFVLVDTEGNISGAELEEVEAVADRIVVPIALTPLEIAKTYETTALLSQPKKARLLINRVRINTTAWKQRDHSLAAFSVKPLKTFVKHRTAYANFLIDGWSALNRDAIHELEKLAWELS